MELFKPLLTARFLQLLNKLCSFPCILPTYFLIWNTVVNVLCRGILHINSPSCFFLNTSQNHFYYLFCCITAKHSYLEVLSSLFQITFVVYSHAVQLQFSNYILHIFFFACIWQLQVTRSDLQYIEKCTD